MTVLLPAWLQAGSYSAEIDRFINTALLTPEGSFKSRGGVRRVTGSEFNVTQTTTASMQLNVGAGIAFVAGTYGATQGTYTVVNDASVQITIGPASTTNPRYDLVVLEVLDSVYSGASNLAQLRVIPGTASSSPQFPTVTGNYLILAQVLVPTNTTSITQANVLDRRPFTAAMGQPIAVFDLANRNLLTPYDGMQCHIMSNNYELQTYANGRWWGHIPKTYGTNTFNYISGIGNGDTFAYTVVDRAKVPDPGWPYHVWTNYSFETSVVRGNFYTYVESTNTANQTVMAAFTQGDYSPGVNGYQRVQAAQTFGQVFTGTVWVSLKASREPGDASSTGFEVRSYYPNWTATLAPVRQTSLLIAPYGGPA